MEVKMGCFQVRKGAAGDTRRWKVGPPSMSTTTFDAHNLSLPRLVPENKVLAAKAVKEKLSTCVEVRAFNHWAKRGLRGMDRREIGVRRAMLGPLKANRLKNMNGVTSVASSSQDSAAAGSRASLGKQYY